jgi:hypothetical protein
MSSTILWLIEDKPEIYVDLLYSVTRIRIANGHDYSFQDNAQIGIYSAQSAFTDSNQLGGDDLSGKVKLKVEPLPTSLSTQIFPPCSSTNFFAKVNPSPVPSLL